MSGAHPMPYVPVELLGGRLVRVCPECKEQIGERTDDEGIVSNNFAKHYGARHAEQEPERQRGYVLAVQLRDHGESRPASGCATESEPHGRDHRPEANSRPGLAAG